MRLSDLSGKFQFFNKLHASAAANCRGRGELHQWKADLRSGYLPLRPGGKRRVSGAPAFWQNEIPLKKHGNSSTSGRPPGGGADQIIFALASAFGSQEPKADQQGRRPDRAGRSRMGAGSTP